MTIFHDSQYLTFKFGMDKTGGHGAATAIKLYELHKNQVRERVKNSLERYRVYGVVRSYRMSLV